MKQKEKLFLNPRMIEHHSSNFAILRAYEYQPFCCFVCVWVPVVVAC